MNSSTTTIPSAHATAAMPLDVPRPARTVLSLLQKLKHGSLTVQWPEGTVTSFGRDQSLHAHLHLNDWSVCSAALKSGDIGFAESFIAGAWSTSNLTDLLRLMVRNRREVEGIIYGTWWGQLAYKITHWMRRNTKANSQKNIHAHYDLGNAFYQLWLDSSMNYSSALFNGRLDQSLTDAQHAKVQRALNEVALQPGQRLLEIGCGWGALAEMASTKFQAQVTGVTLSHEQLAYANARMQRLGVGHQVELRLQDYRDINDAPFDAICSIEMVEAVGREFWPTYFASVARLLKPRGKACVQSIVIQDELFERYVGSPDFIQQYIFPGGCLPSPIEFRKAANRAGLDVVKEHAFGPDYAETLRRWRDKFLAEKSAVNALKFDERFMRIWEFYLCYCEAAFAEGNIDVIQYTLQKK